jgi:uncharacterized protein YggE
MAGALLALAGLAAGAPAGAQVASPAAAQSPAPQAAPAPWWTAQPVIASTGYVETDLRSNRASFTAQFRSVSRTGQEANRAAAAQVRDVARSLAAVGAERVQVQTGFDTQPIFEQYRDRQGNRIENERADRIENYESTATLEVEVRDLRLLEQTYAAVLAARPTSVGQVEFRLDPGNEARTELFSRAVQDAARRARLATESTGARLGPVRLIDPTGRACETDVLVAGAPRSYGQPGVEPQAVPAPPPPPAADADGGEVQSVIVTGSRVRGQQPTPEDLRVPLQAPLQRLTARACVVYALGG